MDTIARNPLELIERGLPTEGLVAWKGPWTYFKPVSKKAAASPERKVVGWVIGEFSVYTNHERCDTRSRLGLRFTHGWRKEEPRDFDTLKAWMRNENLPVDGLTPTRPELPPFRAQESE